MELIIQQWNVDEVKPYELNAKIHDKAQVERIAQSIKEFGWDQPHCRGQGRRNYQVGMVVARRLCFLA
ncbi:hypothetical protein ABVN80_14730 [Acinetobacter baumannii]